MSICKKYFKFTYMIAFPILIRSRLITLWLNRFMVLLLVSGISVIINSCSGPNHEKKYRIGFAQCTGTENWKKATRDGMQRELSFHPGTELIYRSANDNSDLQVKQIKELIGQNIDILLVSPNEAQPLTA